MKSQYFLDPDFLPLEKITQQFFNFDFYINPSYKQHYKNFNQKEITSFLFTQNAKGVRTFIDVGAHYGYFDILVGISNTHCDIYAFEPCSEKYRILLKNLDINKISAHTYQKAVGKRPGHKNFELSTGNDNIVKANTSFKKRRSDQVDTVVIDDFLPQIADGPIMVRINVEGSEIDVIEGMSKFFERFDDIRLNIEFNPKRIVEKEFKPDQLFSVLSAKGFQIYFIDKPQGQYRKYKKGTDWQNYLQENDVCNLICTKNKNTLNLCFFSHSSQLAGSERTLLDLIKNLISDYGTICSVFLPQPGKLSKKLNEIGCATILAPLNWWSTDSINNFDKVRQGLVETFIWMLENDTLLSGMSPDIVITNTIVIPWGAYFAHKNNLPHLWMINEYGEVDHNFKFVFPFKQITSFIEDNSNIVITCSDAVKHTLFPNADQKKVRTIYRSFKQIENPLPNDRKLMFFTRDDSFKLVMPSSIMPSKGQEDAIRAVIELVRHRNKNVELLMIGYCDDLEHKASLEEIISTNHLMDSIHILPFHEEIRSILYESDVILMCSKNEAFGRVTVEGMLMKKPVIGTNSGGTLEIIKDGETGLLYEPGNHIQLANQIEKLIDNVDLQNKLATNGFLYVSEKFTKEKISDKFFPLLIMMRDSNEKTNNQSLFSMRNFSRFLFEEYKQEQNLIINERDRQLHDLEQQIHEIDQHKSELNQIIQEKDQEILYYASSKSWRLTRPFRKVMMKLRGNKRA